VTYNLEQLVIKLHILIVLYKNIAFRSEGGTDVKVFTEDTEIY